MEILKSDKMDKIFLDMSQINSCTAVFGVIPAGTTIYSMPANAKDEYRKFADDYGIHFIFDDDIVNVDFYAVPQIDIVAIDSQGGYMGTVGATTDIESDAPICYLDKNRKVFLIADSLKEFIESGKHWRNNLLPYDKIELFASKEEANKKYDFYDIDSLDI